ncbi:MAG: hypothetical protein RW306_15155 [Geobacteraceae bacterium]|nr:hypothetical protein [Geobacteraceae bacterium]
MRIFIMILLSITLSITPAWSAGQPEVKVQLSARKIVKNSQGKESISGGDSAKPGEVIEYRATYKNSGTAIARNVAATLPIPEEMEFMADSASPAGASASTDGTVFSAIPLVRKVKLAYGAVSNREVPTAEYRSLRWNLGDLAPGAAATVSARMKIKDNQKGPVIIKLDSVKKSNAKKKGGEK